MTKTAEMTELHLEHEVEKLLTTYDWLWFHTRQPRYSPGGMPDIVAVRNQEHDKRILFAELKRRRGHLRPRQEVWLHDLSAIAALSGGRVEVHLWRPADLEDGTIEQVLRGGT